MIVFAFRSWWKLGELSALADNSELRDKSSRHLKSSRFIAAVTHITETTLSGQFDLVIEWGGC